jgi:hypothetical protein
MTVESRAGLLSQLNELLVVEETYLTTVDDHGTASF